MVAIPKISQEAIVQRTTLPIANSLCGSPIVHPGARCSPEHSKCMHLAIGHILLLHLVPVQTLTYPLLALLVIDTQWSLRYGRSMHLSDVYSVYPLKERSLNVVLTKSVMVSNSIIHPGLAVDC